MLYLVVGGLGLLVLLLLGLTLMYRDRWLRLVADCDVLARSLYEDATAYQESAYSHAAADLERLLTRHLHPDTLEGS